MVVVEQEPEHGHVTPADDPAGDVPRRPRDAVPA